MPASARPWTSFPGVRLLGVPFADIGRSGAIIDCVAVEIFQNAGHTWPFTMSEGEMREMLGKEVCDISQSIQRGPTKKLGTITTATTLYFYGHDLVLPGKYFYLLSGYPRGLAWDVMGGPTVSHKTLGRKQMKDGRPRDTNHFTKEVIGKGYSLPECAVAHYAMFLCRDAPWWKRRCCCGGDGMYRRCVCL